MKKILFVGIVIITSLFIASLAQSYVPENPISYTLKLALDNLTHVEFYYALANPTVSYVKVNEGLRKEQIAQMLAKRFNWKSKDILAFVGDAANATTSDEGKYFPDVYVVNKNATGAELRDVMLSRFDEKTKDIKDKIGKGKTNFDTALKIASIIQREAAGKKDMNLISGIIWNRLFAGMPLQIDATLQYVKGSKSDGWWTEVDSADKNLKSPYNTYLNKGLPPTPISNPGTAAIAAALAPQKTSCLFYLHENGEIHCSKTYAGHKDNIAAYLTRK